MRKLFSIVVLALLSIPIAAPLFASMRHQQASLPLCCRNVGKHHCAMVQVAADSGTGDQFAAPRERCPYAPSTSPATHSDRITPAASSSLMASPASHPTGIPQTESRRRIARDRSRQKRGPPTLLG